MNSVKPVSLVFLSFLIISAGCTGWGSEDYTTLKNVTVSDRVMTVGFGTICGCSIATTDDEAYSVGYYTDCAKLTPGSNATLVIQNGLRCEVIGVRKIP